MRKHLFIFVLCVAFCLQLNAQNATLQPYECIPSRATRNLAELGQQFYFCVHIVKKDAPYIIEQQLIPATEEANQTNVTVLYAQSHETYVFRTYVDDFSAFKIGNISTAWNSINDSNIWAVIQGYNSTITSSMLILNNSETFSRSTFSFVVNIVDGNITFIKKDNADCGACDSDQECDQTYNYDYEKDQERQSPTVWQCFDRSKYPVSSDPRFFISWIGSDINGDYMLSHTRRLSRFTQYSIGSIYNKAKNIVAWD